MTILQNPVIPIVVRFSMSECSLRVENRRTLESIRPDRLPYVESACAALGKLLAPVVERQRGRAMDNASARTLTAEIASVAAKVTSETDVLFAVSLETDEDRERIDHRPLAARSEAVSAPWTSPDGSIVLYHGDARDVLQSLPRVDMLLTDPPYGVQASTTGMRVARALPLATIANDRPEDRPIVDEVLSIAWSKIAPARHAYVFGPFDLSTLRGCSSPADLVWDKVAIGPGDTECPWATTHERIAFGARMEGTQAHKRGGGLARVRSGSVLRVPRPVGARVLHPTEKPVQLLRILIEMSSRHGETVLDPFAGSGSTLVAALLEGRRAIGIEVERAWFDVAVSRLEALTQQLSMFGEASA